MMSSATASGSTDDVELLHDHATSAERKELLGGAGDDSSEEDFFLSGPKVGSKLREDGGNGAMSGLQNQVREVTDIMRENVSKMLDRGERLDELNARSEALSDASAEFRSSSLRVRNRMWWQNTKAKLAMGGAGAVVLIIIIIIAAS